MQDFDVIETPENVELQRRLAGIGSRFIAGLIDNLILAGVFVAIVVAFLIAGLAGMWGSSLNPQAWVTAILVAAAFVVYWGYFVFFELWTNGQTPGKKSLKIRVVRQDGGPITFIDVAIRNLLRVVDSLGLYGVAGVVMFFSKKSQRLGGLAAGTVVVSEEVPSYSSGGTGKGYVHWEREATAEALRATGLTAEEYRALSNYWARREQLSFEARQRLLPKLMEPILKRTGQSLPDASVSTIESCIFTLLTKASTAEGHRHPSPPFGFGVQS